MFVFLCVSASKRTLPVLGSQERHSANPLFLEEAGEPDPYRDPKERDPLDDDDIAPAAYFSPERYEAPADPGQIVYAEGNPTQVQWGQSVSFAKLSSVLAICSILPL